MQNERLLDTVKGYAEAKARVASYIRDFNESNGAGRMVESGNGLSAYDQDGSGEFVIARCMNANEARTCKEEIYQILVLP